MTTKTSIDWAIEAREEYSDPGDSLEMSYHLEEDVRKELNARFGDPSQFGFTDWFTRKEFLSLVRFPLTLRYRYPWLSRAEISQLGFILILKAVDRFDPSRGRFVYFARSFVVRQFKSDSEVRRTKQSRPHTAYGPVKLAVDELLAEGCALPLRVTDIAKRSGISAEMALSSMVMLALHGPSYCGIVDFELLGLTPAPVTEAEDEAHKGEEHLQSLIRKSLKGDSQKVMLLREVNKYPFCEVATFLDVTEAYARQLYRRAGVSLRRFLEREYGPGIQNAREGLAEWRETK